MFMSLYMATILVIGVIWSAIWAVLIIRELYFTGDKWKQIELPPDLGCAPSEEASAGQWDQQ